MEVKFNKSRNWTSLLEYLQLPEELIESSIKMYIPTDELESDNEFLLSDWLEEDQMFQLSLRLEIECGISPYSISKALDDISFKVIE